jgi:hypothetical protein
VRPFALPHDEQGSSSAIAADGSADARYEPPAVTRLGSLAALTRGGTTGVDDGAGFAGDLGSL